MVEQRSDKRAVLVMAYGTPKGLGDVEAYYTDIRHGRAPSPELIEGLKARYRAIGGHSPLLEITEAQAQGLAERLGVPAYVGQKHASPSIGDAIEAMAKEGIELAVGIVLAPHYSTMSIGDYARRVKRAADEKGWPGRFEVIRNWHLEPGYISFLANEVMAAGKTLPQDAGEPFVLFTAHSLPERILQDNDPYPDQLRETAAAVAGAAGIERWDTAWQSAGRTKDPWLGPDLVEVIEKLAADGVDSIVVCPCGFVADHLEVLYDIDIEAKAVADRVGVALARTRSPNVDPGFLDAVAGAVRRTFTSLG
jgi:ferrochelatase